MPSASSASGLAGLKAEQDRKFSELTPNAKACFASIAELDRYEKLTDDTGGVIVITKNEIARAIEKLGMAVDKDGIAERALAASRSSTTVDEKTGQPVPILSLPVQKGLHSALRDLSYLAKTLVGLLRDLDGFEKEVAYLEPRVLDDRNLPDFDALKDKNRGDNPSDFDRATADLAESLKPIKWSASYEVSDTVVAPNEENARLVMAMRIKRDVSAESIVVCRQDEPSPLSPISDILVKAGIGFNPDKKGLDKGDEKR